MREVDLVGIRFEKPGDAPLVMLRETNGRRFLPIWIGAPEASAIALAQEGAVPPRPLTHDLLVDVVEALGHEVSEVRITSLTHGTFHAVLVLGDLEVTARPSDAIAIAVRRDLDIFCAESVLDEAGIEVEEDEETEVERFREFLDHVDPDDFLTEGGGEAGPPPQ